MTMLAAWIVPREKFVRGALGYANNCKVKLLDGVEREIKVLGVESNALLEEPDIERANLFIRKVREHYWDWV